MAHNEYVEARGRNFAWVQKIENLPEDWEEKLKAMLIPAAYVLHDKDTDEEGELIDPHLHVFFYFSGKRTSSGVVGMLDWAGVKYVEKIECKNAYLAYMLHLEQENKHVYRYDELQVINGLKVNFADLVNVDFGDVLEFAEERGITRFAQLTKTARKANPPLFRYITGHYGLVLAYFQDEREFARESEED